MAEIRLNGTARTVSAKTVGELLQELDLDPRWVVCELNGEPLPRESFLEARIMGGDRLELVRPVAGG